MRTISAVAAVAMALTVQDGATKKPLVAKVPSGGAALEFDWPALEIGVAEYDEGPTGATLFRFPKRAHVVVDARGGAPCTILTEALQYGYADSEPAFVDAICFAGGSCYGLEAACGVMDGLLDERRGSTGRGEIAYVPGAIVFDFTGRDNAVHPDRELGRAALKGAKSGRFPLGSRGAGRFVHCGSFFGPRFMERSGQGGTFRQIGLAKIAVFTVVNALGAIVGRDGAVVRGNRDPKTGARTSIEADLRDGTRRNEWNDEATKTPPPATAPPPKRNTTLTLVVTNLRLPFSELKRVAIEVHSSMARAIQPFHTPWDGDTLFAATTAEVDDAALGSIGVAMAASDLAWDAIASAESHAEDDPPATKRTDH